MFGYVKPYEYQCFVKDIVLYKALYCGLCKSIGQGCNQISRFSVSYDVTFLSAILHNTEGVDVTVEKQHCCTHWITKRPVALPDELSVTLARLNVLLAYRKLLDDKLDENKGGFKRAVFRKAYKKAKQALPEADTVIKEEYARLTEMERQNEASADKVADAFGVMMQRILSVLPLKNKSEALSRFAYFIGKWIYLIDALDDFEKDVKKNAYNVFRFAYPTAKTREEFISQASGELKTLFSTTIFAAQSAFSELQFYFNHDLLDNIVFQGIPRETERIMKKGEDHEKSL